MDEGMIGTVTGRACKKRSRGGSLNCDLVYEVENVLYTTGDRPVRLFRISGSLPFCAAARLTRPMALRARLLTFMLTD